jgi:regulatory protein YycH of two-component signal transduction system YycFG
MLIFVLSMYWSYKGFVVRNDFASYNIDDLFNIMKDKESNLTVFKISNILENYQIYVINTKVNFAKAASLALAARLFIVGIITFAISSLCVLIGIKK